MAERKSISPSPLEEDISQMDDIDILTRVGRLIVEDKMDEANSSIEYIKIKKLRAIGLHDLEYAQRAKVEIEKGNNIEAKITICNIANGEVQEYLKELLKVTA